MQTSQSLYSTCVGKEKRKHFGVSSKPIFRYWPSTTSLMLAAVIAGDGTPISIHIYAHFQFAHYENLTSVKQKKMEYHNTVFMFGGTVQ